METSKVLLSQTNEVQCRWGGGGCVVVAEKEASAMGYEELYRVMKEVLKPL